MGDKNERALDWATRVSDGDRVDWSDLEHEASSPDERAVVVGLRLLASVSDVHLGRSSTVLDQDSQIPTVTTDDGMETVDGRVVAFPEPTGRPLGQWGHLELIEKIGEGAFGEVYRARDTRLDREVALKLMRPSAGHRRRETSTFIREGRLMAKVRHPNVVSVYGAEEHDGSVGVWMEFVRGRTLEALIREQGTFGAREASVIGIDLCRALAAVHKAGLVHRDVKAQNAMRGEGGRILLMDFGAGWDAEEGSQAADTSISGTPMYMAPETILEMVTSVRSDIYSLGVLLYHMVTGTYPVCARSIVELRQAHVRGEARLLRDERSDLPGAFVNVVELALARNPEARFATAGQMEQRLSAALGVAGEPERLEPLEASQTPGESSKRSRLAWYLGATAAAVLALVLVGWLAFSVLSESTQYSVEASAVRVNRDGRRERLASGSRVALGDRLTLEIEASRSLHVYVINEDELGNAYALFPLPDLDLKNPLPPGRHTLPGTQGGHEISWEMTTTGGREHLLIVASPERLIEFEAEMAALSRPQAGQVALELPEKALVHLRGFGGMARVEPDPDTASAGRVFEMADELALEVEVVEGAWVRQIELENPPPAR